MCQSIDMYSIIACLVLQNVCVKLSKHILIWVEEQTYWIASRFLMLGFELELYSPSEYCMVYWYMYVVLIKLAEKHHLKMVMSNDTGECRFISVLHVWYFIKSTFIPFSVVLMQDVSWITILCCHLQACT